MKSDWHNANTAKALTRMHLSRSRPNNLYIYSLLHWNGMYFECCKHELSIDNENDRKKKRNEREKSRRLKEATAKEWNELVERSMPFKIDIVYRREWTEYMRLTQAQISRNKSSLPHINWLLVFSSFSLMNGKFAQHEMSLCVLCVHSFQWVINV